jgi:hypothetical protein
MSACGRSASAVLEYMSVMMALAVPSVIAREWVRRDLRIAS